MNREHILQNLHLRIGRTALAGDLHLYHHRSGHQQYKPGNKIAEEGDFKGQIQHNIRSRKIIGPQERLPADFNGILEEFPQGNQYRKLQQVGQTSAQGIHLGLLEIISEWLPAVSGARLCTSSCSAFISGLQLTQSPPCFRSSFW